jgi:8-oxo-dGTP diphosphatase
MSDENGIGSGGTGCILFLPIAIIAGLIAAFRALFDHNPKHKRAHKNRRQYISSRRRGTAIVDTKQGILVTAGRNKVFLLPGGGANQNESRTQAAIRELREETGLKTVHVKFLFRYIGGISKSHGHGYFRDYHTVCLIEAVGTARPGHEIKYIDYYRPGRRIRLSRTTKKIIDKYYAWQRRR